MNFAEKIGALTFFHARVIRDYARGWAAQLTADERALLQGLCAVPRYALGWTGWVMGNSGGISSQFLAAIVPYLNKPFHGGRYYIDRLGRQHNPEFYYVNVPAPSRKPHPLGYELHGTYDVRNSPGASDRELDAFLAMPTFKAAEWLHASWRALAMVCIERTRVAQNELHVEESILGVTH